MFLRGALYLGNYGGDFSTPPKRFFYLLIPSKANKKA